MPRTRVAQSSKKVLIKACFYPYFLTTLSNKYEGHETFVWAKMFTRNMFGWFEWFVNSHGFEQVLLRGPTTGTGSGPIVLLDQCP